MVVGTPVGGLGASVGLGFTGGCQFAAEGKDRIQRPFHMCARGTNHLGKVAFSDDNRDRCVGKNIGEFGSGISVARVDGHRGDLETRQRHDHELGVVVAVHTDVVAGSHADRTQQMCGLVGKAIYLAVVELATDGLSFVRSIGVVAPGFAWLSSPCQAHAVRNAFSGGFEDVCELEFHSGLPSVSASHDSLPDGGGPAWFEGALSDAPSAVRSAPATRPNANR
jgi:hypothetical protein